MRTPCANGLPRRIIVLRHALRSALLPMTPALNFRQCWRALVTETVFTWPGMGMPFLDSLSNRAMLW
jgi:ABC-type dipeptide/oligopeptide/nickel transport system permease component